MVAAAFGLWHSCSLLLASRGIKKRMDAMDACSANEMQQVDIREARSSERLTVGNRLAEIDEWMGGALGV